jgi:hypothetical protein
MSRNLSLSACSTLTPATDSRYVSADGKVAIRGELVDGSDVRIFVNDSKVIDDRISLLHGDGKFGGSFEGKAVSADCSTAGQKHHVTTCMVAVGSERAHLRL